RRGTPQKLATGLRTPWTPGGARALPDGEHDASRRVRHPVGEWPVFCPPQRGRPDVREERRGAAVGSPPAHSRRRAAARRRECASARLERREEAQHGVALGGPQALEPLLRACPLAAVEPD